jgi:hypothetical protein
MVGDISATDSDDDQVLCGTNSVLCTRDSVEGMDCGGGALSGDEPGDTGGNLCMAGLSASGAILGKDEQASGGGRGLVMHDCDTEAVLGTIGQGTGCCDIGFLVGDSNEKFGVGIGPLDQDGHMR